MGVAGPGPGSGDQGRVLSSAEGAALASSAVLVSPKQRGNPLLRYVRNVRWFYVDGLVPDYQVGATAAMLFLSLKYHLLHPGYIHFRLREMQRAFRVRVLLVHVDVDDPAKPLGAVSKVALLSDFTLMCGWNYEECARYVETFKAYESKPPDLLFGRSTGQQDYAARAAAALTTVRGVNRTDVLTLTASLGSLAGVLGATMEQLSALPGMGPQKVRRLHDAFNQPFFADAPTTGKEKGKDPAPQPKRAPTARGAGVAGGMRGEGREGGEGGESGESGW